eukprot:51851-Pleurochrysis_carterae.AAC.1
MVLASDSKNSPSPSQLAGGLLPKRRFPTSSAECVCALESSASLRDRQRDACAGGPARASRNKSWQEESTQVRDYKLLEETENLSATHFTLTSAALWDRRKDGQRQTKLGGQT